MSNMDLQTARSVDAEIPKLIAVSAKLNAMSAEQAWHPAVLMTIAVFATAVLVTVLL